MVSQFFQPMVCGISVYVTSLVKGLVNHGVNVHVETMRYDGHPAKSNQGDGDLSISRFRNLPFFGGDSLNQPISLHHILETINLSNDFDVIHLQDCPKLLNDTIILALKKIKPEKPIIITPQGPGMFSPTYIMSSKTTGKRFEVQYEKGLSYSMQKIFSKLYWSSGVPVKVVQSADHIIAVTPTQRETFTRVCDEGKVSMITEAVPSSYFVKEPSFVSEGRLKVLFIGRIIREKGIHDLLCAVKAYTRMSDKPIELRCIGPDFGFMQEAQQIIKELGLGKTVVMLGAVSEEEKLAHLRWCDVLTTASYHEAFGIPIVEAMAHGKPVIATKTVGATYILEDQENGFLVNFSDPDGIASHLAQFASDPTLKFTMGQKALARAHQFSMEKMITNHIELYEQVLKQKTSGYCLK